MIGEVSLSDAAVIFVSGGSVGAIIASAYLWPGLQEVRRAAGELEQRVRALQLAIYPFIQAKPDVDWLCHKGLVSPEECGRCGPIIRARRILGIDPPGGPNVH